MSGAVVIVGATGAVGDALARRLAMASVRVIVAGRDEDRLRALADELDCHFLRCDVSDGRSVQACLEDAQAIAGSVRGVANCAGSLNLKPAHGMSDDEFEAVIDTNLTGAFRTLKAAVSVMRASGGSIVLVSSAAAQIGLPNHEGIAAAKAGVEGLVRSAAATYASRGIRINAVAPGLTKSEMTRHLWENRELAEASEQMHALGRLGEPEDIASAIAWLLSDDSDWVTGQIVGVDGGLSRVLGRTKMRK